MNGGIYPSTYLRPEKKKDITAKKSLFPAAAAVGIPLGGNALFLLLLAWHDEEEEEAAAMNECCGGGGV